MATYARLKNADAIEVTDIRHTTASTPFGASEGMNLGNNKNISARNAANSANVNIGKLNTSDQFELALNPYLPGNPTAALQTATKQYADALFPVGSMIMWGSNTPPTNYLICDGTAISRTTYATLFGILSTTYGVGDGATTFNLPDLRQRFPLGKAAAGTGNTLGATGGAIDHTHTQPTHTHTVTSHTHSVPAHYHSTTATGATIAINSSGAHTHDMDTNESSTAASGGDNVMVSTVQTTNDGLTTNSSSHTHSHSDFTGTVGLVTGGVNGDAAMTSGSASPTTDAQGGDTTGTNNPPFMVVNFIIKAL